MKEKECKHSFRIFRDAELDKSGQLTFYCQNCLKLVKKKKEYENE